MPLIFVSGEETARRKAMAQQETQTRTEQSSRSDGDGMQSRAAGPASSARADPFRLAFAPFDFSRIGPFALLGSWWTR
jgi:hypothetical protein